MTTVDHTLMRGSRPHDHCMSSGSSVPPCDGLWICCDQPAAGGTRRAMAQTKPASSVRSRQ